MIGTTPNGIEIDRDFAASPGEVFAAWTTAESFSEWFGGAAVEVPLESLDFVAAPGRGWTAQMLLPGGATMDWAGEFLEVDPGRHLVLTITDRPAESDRARIVVDLDPVPTGTRMHFTQQTPGFSPEQQQGVLAGWQSFMDVLGQVAER